MTLDLDAITTLLETITTTARNIDGIRTAYDFDEWPQSPPSMPNREAALHLTGMPTEEAFSTFRIIGPNFGQYEFVIPLYTVVIDAANVHRARSWALPYFDRYRQAFVTRARITDTAGNDGSVIYRGAGIDRKIRDFPGYDGFYMLRHELAATLKGAIDLG